MSIKEGDTLPKTQFITMTDDGPVIANLMVDGIHDENIKMDE